VSLLDLFNLAARKGQASTVFVPQKQQPSYFEMVNRAPQRASTIFVPAAKPKSYLEIASETPQQASTIFVPAATTQMPSYVDTATQASQASPLFRFPTKAKQNAPVQRPAPKPAAAPASATVFAPVSLPAGTVTPGATIVMGLSPTGEVDRSQSDEYKSQLAQYRNLIAKEKQAEAEDLGMQIWMQKYGRTPMAQAGGFIGAKNPLLAATFPETQGYPAFVPSEELAEGDLGKRAQGELGPTMESLNPLAQQAAQQAATADQADMATTVRLPIRNRVQAFLQGGM
jgi:hypothetical protein